MARPDIVVENKTSKHLLVYREVWNTDNGQEPKKEEDEDVAAYLARRKKVGSFQLTLGSTFDDNDEVDDHNDDVREKAKGEPDPRDLIPLPTITVPGWALAKLKKLSANYRRDIDDGVIRELRAA